LVGTPPENNSTTINTINTIKMSITLTAEMFAKLDDKTKVAVLALVAAPVAIVEKPKKTLSPEHIAAMKAGREKKAAEAYEAMTPEQKAEHDAKKAKVVVKKVKVAAVAPAMAAPVPMAAPVAVAAPVPIVEKPKKIISPEHLAAMKAGREKKEAEAYEAMTPEQKAQHDAKKAKAAAKKATASAKKAVAPAVAPVVAPVVAVAVPVPTDGSISDSASSSSGSAKKRGPKKLDDMTHEERAKHDAKIAERKAKKEAMTPEEKLADAMKKAAAKAAREKKAAVKAAEVPMRAASPPKEKAE